MDTLKYQKFISDTLEKSSFIVENVADDNACFYRALGNQLFYRSCYDKAHIICSKNNRIRTKALDKVIDNELWGYDGKQQTKMAKILQQTARKILYKNRKKTVEELGITVNDFVIYTHDMSEMYDLFEGWEDIDIYNEIYKTFAGNNVMVRHNDKLLTLKERWGGAPEQWALSKYFKMPVVVYHLQKYNKHTNKIEQGRLWKDKPTKNSRFRVFQIFGAEYIGKTPPLNILFKKIRDGGHYYTLYENDN